MRDGLDIHAFVVFKYGKTVVILMNIAYNRIKNGDASVLSRQKLDL